MSANNGLNMVYLKRVVHCVFTCSPLQRNCSFDDKYLDFHGWEPVKSCGRDDPRARQNSVFRTSRSLVQTPHKSLVFFLSFALVIMFFFKIKPNKATTFVEGRR